MNLRRAFFALFLAVFCCLCAAPAPAADAESLKTRLQREQANAVARRASLQRLTSEEKRLNAGLAAAEKRILQLERGIADQQAKLEELAQSDAGAQAEYEKLSGEIAETEKSMGELLNLLWEIAGKRISMGGREMADWDVTDREYIWSRELYAELEGYRGRLKEQEVKLAAVLARRQKIADSVNQSLALVTTEKETLLRERIAYTRKLETLRDKKKDEEEELQDILKLVGDLNFQLEKAGQGKIESLKGRLPRPVQGAVRLTYAPEGDPPRRGLGMSAKEGQKVTAVAAGKVVHNDVLRGFGRVVILQHGSDYYSLYAFLGESSLPVGRQVAAGGTLGTVGWYPAISGYGLYFELRYKQKAVNPTPWFGS